MIKSSTIALASITLASISLSACAGDKGGPMSTEDSARVEELLSDFDPDSYSLSFKAQTLTGAVKEVKLGSAVGLADLQQTAVERAYIDQAVASTNVNNNVFSVASTNVNNNIFRVASTNVNNNVFSVARTNVNNNIFSVAKTNVNNNVFIEAGQAAAAEELNAILNQYAGE
jgi:hypothetical protein